MKSLRTDRRAIAGLMERPAKEERID